MAWTAEHFDGGVFIFDRAVSPLPIAQVFSGIEDAEKMALANELIFENAIVVSEEMVKTAQAKTRRASGNLWSELKNLADGITSKDNRAEKRL